MRPLRFLAVFILARAGGAQDCNGNGLPDSQDVGGGSSADCNLNGVPDECDVAPTNSGFVMDSFIELGNTADVASEDLNGDGLPDVAATLTESREIAVLLAGDGAFPVTSYFPVSLAPESIRLADLDGDGDVDAATSSPTADTVSVLWNDGAGGLADEVLLLVGQVDPVAHVTDLDGDGDMDLLTLNRNPGGGPSNVSVLSNEGAGRFAAGRHFAAGDGALALALADLDGDDDPDTAVVGSGTRINILENDGAGRFLRMTTFAVRLSPTDVSAGDFNRDGSVDLCLRRQSTVVVFFNRGDGTFAESSPVEASTNFLTMAMVTADLDGNGGLDVALIGSGMILLNDGAGTFTARSMMSSAFGASAAAADLDQDGDEDLVTAGRSGVAIHINRPVAVSADCNGNRIPDECESDCDANRIPDDCDLASGTLQDRDGNTIPDFCELDCDGSGTPDGWDIALGTTPDCNHNLVPDPCELPVADCNANAIPDACEVEAGAAADCNANGIPDECDVEREYGFRGISRSPFAWSRDGGFTLVDVDGDGLVDLLASSLQGLLLFRDIGHRELRSGVVIAPGGGPLAAADLDGDGHTDVCLARSGRYFYSSRTDIGILLQRAGGTFEERTAVTLPFGVESIVAADLDTDGIPDIGLSGRGRVLVLPGRGGGTFGEPSAVFARDGKLTPADLDRDGDTDLLCLDGEEGNAAVLINDGNGLFTEHSSLPAGARGLIAEDLDGDGDIDLATGGGHLYTNDGRAGFSLLRKFGDLRGSSDGKSVASGDMDADGDLDLFLVDAGAVWTLRNEGGASFQEMNRVNLPSSPLTLASMDLDRDGRADLIGGGGGEIWILRTLTEPQSYGQIIYFYADGVRNNAVAAEDLDEDGDEDLVIAGRNGRVTIEENQGDGLFRTAQALQVAAAGTPPALAAADFDGDGDRDIALGLAARVFLVWNDGQLTLRIGESLTPFGLVSSMTVADFDRDGDPDLAAAGTQDDFVSMFFYDQGERFVTANPVRFDGRQVFVEALDADGDGDVDLAVGHEGLFGAPRGFSFLLNDGSASFDLGGTIPLRGAPAAARTGDFNGDGRADLAISFQERGDCAFFGCQNLGSVSIFVSTEKDKFRELRVSDGMFVSEGFAASDLDLDGDLDLVLPQTSFLDFDVVLDGASVEILLNEGDGSFARAAPLHTGSAPSCVAASDLDGDGLPDLATVSPQSLSIAYSRLTGTSPDQDHDGVPDECRTAPFRRGDADADGSIGLTDAVFLLEHLFRGGAAPACEKAADANDDGQVNIADPVSLLEHLFRGGPAPPAPGASCGLDPTPDALSCEAHAPCA